MGWRNSRRSTTIGVVDQGPVRPDGQADLMPGMVCWLAMLVALEQCCELRLVCFVLYFGYAMH